MHTRAWALATLNLLLIPSLPFAFTPSFCVALAGAAEGAAASNARPRSLDAFFVMRTLEPMRKQLEAAKEGEFAAAQATRVAQQVLLQQERELGLKRRRVEPDEEDRQWHRWKAVDVCPWLNDSNIELVHIYSENKLYNGQILLKGAPRRNPPRLQDYWLTLTVRAATVPNK